MGRPPILNKKLVHKIADKAGKSDLAVVKSISALASRKHVAPEVALILTANKYNIRSASVFKKLNPQQQIQLSAEFSSNTARRGVSDGRGIRKKTIRPVSDIRGEFADPYLPDSLYSNIPSEGYSIMFALENSIRVFITRILSSAFEDKWWEQLKGKKSLKDVVAKVSDRKTKDLENWYHSKRGIHEIYYTDYVDLLRIIRVFDSIFSKLFRKGAAKNLIGKLEELGPTRNVIAHNNPITSKDLERLKVHARDWFAYMKYMKAQSS